METSKEYRKAPIGERPKCTGGYINHRYGPIDKNGNETCTRCGVIRYEHMYDGLCYMIPIKVNNK